MFKDLTMNIFFLAGDELSNFDIHTFLYNFIDFIL